MLKHKHIKAFKWLFSNMSDLTTSILLLSTFIIALGIAYAVIQPPFII